MSKWNIYRVNEALVWASKIINNTRAHYKEEKDGFELFFKLIYKISGFFLRYVFETQSSHHCNFYVGFTRWHFIQSKNYESFFKSPKTARNPIIFSES